MLTRDEFNKGFGQAIKAAREAQGLSRAELAERMRQHPVDPEWYQKWHSLFFCEVIASTFGAYFGGDLYSKEELVAEMGAAFLCAIADVANENTERNTTAYIQNWISKLDDDNRLIVQAAASGTKSRGFDPRYFAGEAR